MTRAVTGFGRNRAVGGLGRLTACAAIVAGSAGLAGCTSGESGQVLGAVFGLEGAPTKPFRVGSVPEPAVQPGDQLIGEAANSSGQCIYRRQVGQRFRATCPEGYSP